MHVENNHRNNKISHLLGTLKVPSDVLSASYALSHLISAITHHVDSIIHLHLLDKEIEVYGVIVTWPKSTASSGLASVGKAGERAFQGRSWTGPNENSALDLLRGET